VDSERHFSFSLQLLDNFKVRFKCFKIILYGLFPSANSFRNNISSQVYYFQFFYASFQLWSHLPHEKIFLMQFLFGLIPWISSSPQPFEQSSREKWHKIIFCLYFYLKKKLNKEKNHVLRRWMRWTSVVGRRWLDVGGHMPLKSILHPWIDYMAVNSCWKSRL